MLRVEASVLLAVLEKRELCYPEELEIKRIEKSESLCALATKRAERVEYNAVLVCNDKNEVAGFSSDSGKASVKSSL